ncbi:hypothetical protein EMIHUDRAFT_193948 [Emiliania huxleyi CCMP1516]|uniref:Uncharacterized protein n=2 Tax=Emiliania huxleyi TaxID=2903 RepID=A0A0D3L0P4_EMIH1|nr:hypothetical protein EMIHUDRAFT_193948 [Emiliania huxleyi CCMP1516]EOD41579.1 hypothetical protein EMIHUDRAFT_193948 [Emiliania huxleyi CCMP1516]|eukprot:XP_005794008.1 hypothetical protein EMIHUDRAFT_193948 [Emiliania huxleyi CCMP1516]
MATPPSPAALAGTLLTTALALSLLRGHAKPSLLTAGACVVTASLQLVADSLLAAEAWTRSTDPIYDPETNALIDGAAPERGGPGARIMPASDLDLDDDDDYGTQRIPGPVGALLSAPTALPHGGAPPEQLPRRGFRKTAALLHLESLFPRPTPPPFVERWPPPDRHAVPELWSLAEVRSAACSLSSLKGAKPVVVPNTLLVLALFGGFAASQPCRSPSPAGSRAGASQAAWSQETVAGAGAGAGGSVDSRATQRGFAAHASSLGSAPPANSHHDLDLDDDDI